MKPILVVGAGFAGAVLARELAREGGYRVRVIDQREHLGGNCHTQRDASTGIMVHEYGPHIFNTNHRETWDYIQQFGEMGAYTNRVKAHTPRGVFSLPINLLTLNQFFGRSMNPREAEAYLRTQGDPSITDPQTFEEQALKMLGREIYENFFLGYTVKQWGVHPRELPASILKRLPVRFNYDDRYYASRYQGIPVEGYTAIIERILQNDAIEVRLATAFDSAMAREFAHVFYTGPLDAFHGHDEGRLGYRTVYWDRHEHEGDYQGNPVINYTDQVVPYTRVHEHKHFAPWEEHERTLVFTEYSKQTEASDIPYYPTRLATDKALMARYRERCMGFENFSFLGRLGTYRYLDMDQVILESRQFAARLLMATPHDWHRPEFRFAALPEAPPPPK